MLPYYRQDVYRRRPWLYNVRDVMREGVIKGIFATALGGGAGKYFTKRKVDDVPKNLLSKRYRTSSIKDYFVGRKRRQVHFSNPFTHENSFEQKQDLGTHQKTTKMPRRYKRKRGKSRSRSKKRVFKKRRRRLSRKPSRGMARKAITMLMAPMTTKEYVEGNVYNCGSNGEEYLIPLGAMRSSFDYETALISTGKQGIALVNPNINASHNYIMFSNIKAQVNNQSNAQAWVRPVYLVAKDRFMDRDLTTVDRFQSTSVLFDRLYTSLRDHYDATDAGTVTIFLKDTYNHAWLCHRPGFKPLSSVGIGRLLSIKYGKWTRIDPLN